MLRAGMIWLEAVAVLIGIIAIEIANGIFRLRVLTPRFKDFRARQISLVLGCINILIVAWCTEPWIGARTHGERFGIGTLWLVLMVAFEVGFGRFYLGMSWRRIGEDFNVLRGRLLPLGLVFLALAPQLAAVLRGRP